MKDRFASLLGLGVYWAGGVCAFSAPASPSLSAPLAKSPADLAWSEVLRLDKGPPATGAQGGKSAKDVYSSHLKAQDEALRRYLGTTGSEAHAFEAKLRLAQVLFTLGTESGGEGLKQSQYILDTLEASATGTQKAHVAFARITQKMRQNRFPNKAQRDELLSSARAFQKRFPEDPRAARLLVEVATQLDREPQLKKIVLQDAEKLALEPQLKMRIADDLKKVALMGQVLSLVLPEPGGGEIKLEALRGKPVLLLFFSENSLPSLVAWDLLNEALRAHPNVQRVGVSLDTDVSSLERMKKSYGEDWKISWDGLGWEGQAVRRQGINSAPTAWLLDATGKLVSLNALDGAAAQLAELNQPR